MLPQSHRGVLLVLVLLLASPTAAASHDLVERHQSDLFAGSLVQSGNDERTPTELCLTIQNTAPAGPTTDVAPAFSVRIRIDDARDDSFYFREERSGRRETPMAGGEQDRMCWSFALSAGRYRAAALVDSGDEVNESRETNNVRERIFIVADRPRADLEITSFTISPREGEADRNQAFQVRVRNSGEIDSAPTKLVIIDSTGQLFESQIPALRRLQAYTFSSAMDPRRHDVGDFVAIARIDPDDEQREEREDNNEASVAFRVLPHPLADLRVLDATLEGELAPLRSIRLVATLANLGNYSAGTHVLQLRVDGVVMENSTSSRLSIGANETHEFYLYFLEGGKHNVTLVADPDGLVKELNETDNRFALEIDLGDAGNATVKRPNLVLERFSALPDDPGPGEAVMMNAYVRNVGSEASNATRVRFNVDGRLIGEVDVPTILPGHYHSTVLAWHAHTPGEHSFQAFVDPDNQLAEIYEDDNLKLIFGTLYAPTPRRDPVDDPEPLQPGNATNEDPTGPKEEEPTEPPADPSTSVDLSQLMISTRPTPGGARGTITATLRNTEFEPTGRLTVSFYVDGRRVKEVLVTSIEAAGARSVTSDDIELPAGTHDVRVEVRIVGTVDTIATATQTYEQEEGSRETPTPALGVVIALLAGLALATRRR